MRFWSKIPPPDRYVNQSSGHEAAQGNYTFGHNLARLQNFNL